MAPHRDPEYVLAEVREALDRPGPPPDEDLPETAASVAVVVHMLEAGPALLWIERAANPKDPWSGHMGFPGGHPEEHDESPRHTAERETLEELGIELTEVGEYLGPLNELIVYSRSGPAPFKLSPHVFFVETLPELTPDPSEVAGAHSVTFRHMIDPEQATEKQVTWKGKTFPMPAVRYGERFLWGLSFRVWSDLRHRLGCGDLLAHLHGLEE